MILRIAIMNVGTRYFDKKLVEESLRGYLKEIEEKHPEVKRVLLFGFFCSGQTRAWKRCTGNIQHKSPI